MVSVLMDLEAKNLSATNANGRIADVDQFFTAHLDNVHHVFFFFLVQLNLSFTFKLCFFDIKYLLEKVFPIF
jgi:hypothetical protein